MSTILITGASSGIGNAIARATAAAGHTVYASMRDVAGRNAAAAHDLADFAAERGLTVHPVELDVSDQASADAAVAAILDAEDRLDVVVHNAGHLARGFAEAFTAEQLALIYDINVFGQHRVNRACLPAMRAAGQGYLVYIGSTTTPVPPPFMAPYATSKAAGDLLAETTAYEISQLGIETTIVMPGALREGTNHSLHATAPETDLSDAYAALAPMMRSVGRYIAASTRPGASTADVGAEVVRLLDLPFGTRPRRVLVDFQDSGLERITDRVAEVTESVLAAMGVEQMLHVAPHPSAT
jgi:NAD(P)-dependent dehydrogenase (short-subunit alcohol dehydrogenase family)